MKVLSLGLWVAFHSFRSPVRYDFVICITGWYIWLPLSAESMSLQSLQWLCNILLIMEAVKKKIASCLNCMFFFFWWCAEWVLSNWTAFMSPIKGVKIRSQTGGLCEAGQMVSKQKKETKHISKHQCLDKQRNKALCIRLRGTKGS